MQPSATAGFKRLRRSENIKFSAAAMTEAYVLRDRRKQQSGNRNIKVTIGRGSSFPSATAEKEMIQSFDVKLKNSRCENKQIGKEVGANTACPSAMAGGKANTFRFNHDGNAIKRKMMKFDQSLNFFKH